MGYGLFRDSTIAFASTWLYPPTSVTHAHNEPTQTLSPQHSTKKNHELLRTVVYHRGNVKNDLNVVEYGLQETIFLVMLGRRSFSTRHEECEETIGNPVLTWKKFSLVFFTVSWVLQLNCNFYTQKLHNRTNCVLTVFLNNHN